MSIERPFCQNLSINLLSIGIPKNDLSAVNDVDRIERYNFTAFYTSGKNIFLEMIN
jgi:hypothetical protein